MIGAWRRWLDLLARREPGDALAWFRILTGLALLWNLVPAIVQGLVPARRGWCGRSAGRRRRWCGGWWR